MSEQRAPTLLGRIEPQPPEGSKFRPVHWSDISKPGAPIIGWGLDQKKPGERHYKPVGYDGQIHPFATKAEAQAKCDELNAAASLATPLREDV